MWVKIEISFFTDSKQSQVRDAINDFLNKHTKYIQKQGIEFKEEVDK